MPRSKPAKKTTAAKSKAVERTTQTDRTKQQPVPLTEREYSGLQHAYDYFNRELFAGSLPQLLVTLQRRGNTRGYFSPDRFQSRTNENGTHELALNPDAFPGRTDEDVLSVLVHEMVHHYQHQFGNPGRKRYHNREFADLMRKIGLQTSSTGLPGGKETGQSVSHYILPDGPYRTAYRKLQASDFALHWESLGDSKGRVKPPESKTKFTCETCGQNAWAKPSAALRCGDCEGGPAMVSASYDTHARAA
jgi:hypothetical protein